MSNIIKIKPKKTRNISLMSTNRNDTTSEYNSKIALTQTDDNNITTMAASLMKNEHNYHLPFYKRINNKQMKPYPILKPTSPPKSIMLNEEKTIRKNNPPHHNTNAKIHKENIYQQYNDNNKDVIKSLSCFELTHRKTESSVVHKELSPALSRPGNKKLRINLMKQNKNTIKKKNSLRETSTVTNKDLKQSSFADIILFSARDIKTRNTSNTTQAKTLKSKQSFNSSTNNNINIYESVFNEEIESPEHLHFIFVSLIQKNKKCIYKSEYTEPCEDNELKHKGKDKDKKETEL